MKTATLKLSRSWIVATPLLYSLTTSPRSSISGRVGDDRRTKDPSSARRTELTRHFFRGRQLLRAVEHVRFFVKLSRSRPTTDPYDRSIGWRLKLIL